MSDFPKKLTNRMFDNNVRFAQIMHIPTISAAIHEEVSEEFQDFLSSAVEPYQSSKLLEQCPTLKSVLNKIKKSHDLDSDGQTLALDLARGSKGFEFLIQLEAACPHGFQFSKEGEYESSNIGGRYYLVWILAKNMTEAATLAIAYGTKTFNDELEKAKKAQGIS